MKYLRLFAIGCLPLLPLNAKIIREVSKLSPVHISSLHKPKSTQELQRIVRSAQQSISVAGGRFSQGGQIAYPHGVVIDITGLAKIIHFDRIQKRITVQAGVRWSDVQRYIDPYDLSVSVMQSYNDFTVGGSISVNAHGRSLVGSLIKTIDSLKIMLADGSIVTASRTQNEDLFCAVVGGYGLMGIIVEATLILTENCKIERSIHVCSVQEYEKFFFSEVHNNPNVVFHNANLYPDDFEKIVSITWHKTKKALTQRDRLQQERWYIKEQIEEQLLRRIPACKEWRKEVDFERLSSPEIVWRNYEMSYSVEELEPWVRFPTTSILQEYFVPTGKVSQFVDSFRSIVKTHGVNVLNVSIRYVPKDSESVLSYAPKDSFALVCYLNVFRTAGNSEEQIWTRAFIDAVLAVQGTYYLPYHLWAEKDQFKKAYPCSKLFLNMKTKYDPHARFRNCLYHHYMA